MSATASEVRELPFPALVPWLSTVHLGRVTRATITHGEHNQYVRTFDMCDVTSHFQDFLNQAMRIKSELIKAEEVAKALNG